MLDKRFAGFDGGETMLIKLTPPASVGFLQMGRRMIDRDTRKPTHTKNYGMAKLVAGDEFVITTDKPNAQINIQIAFDGTDEFNEKFSQGSDAALADFRVTVRRRS